MKIRHLAFLLLPALAVADDATTVPDDEPWHPPLPEELLHPEKGNAALPATAQPVVSYRAPANEEQTWLKLLYVKGTEEWPGIFRRMADASRERNMQMCHGYALWLKGQELIHLRYDDDLSLSGIHADGHAYGVLFVEFNPYGVRVCPMEGYDLTGKNGGVCWQNAATRLWSWAEAEQFWAELPKLLKADVRTSISSAQDSAVKREVATKGQRMVVFWAPAGYPARAWWPSFARLHAAVGPQRFSLVAAEGLNLWTDVAVPSVHPAPSARPAAPATGVVPAPSSPTPITAAPPLHAATGKAPTTPASATPAPAPSATPAAPAPPSRTETSQPTAAPAPANPPTASPIPDQLQPASGSPRDVAPAASVRPWALEGGVAPVPGAGRRASTSPAPAEAAAPPPATPPSATPPTTAPPPATPPAGRTLDAVPTIPH